MITEQHLKFIKERNLVFEKTLLGGYFVYKKNHKSLGRYFISNSGCSRQQNIHTPILDYTECVLEDINKDILPYVLSYISDFNLSLFYYQENNLLKICSHPKDYTNPILIRNHDSIYRDEKYHSAIVLVPAAPETINIENAKIIRNPSLERFLVFDNSKEQLYVSKNQILQFLERETCKDAINLACHLLSTNEGCTDKILVPDELLKRLKEERSNFYNELKSKTV